MESPEGLPQVAAPLSPRRQPPPPPLRTGFLRGEAEAEESEEEEEEAAGPASPSSSSGSEEAPPECCEATAHLPYPPPPSPSRYPGPHQPPSGRLHAPPRRRRRSSRVSPPVHPDFAGSHEEEDTDEDDEHAFRQSSEDLAGSPSSHASEPHRRRRARSSSRLSTPRIYTVVRELGPEEVRWFYREDRKTWKPFIGYDSLRIENAFRAIRERPALRAGSPARDPVCVRGGLYEVAVATKDCYPVYWNQTEKIPVMRGQWFIDGTWQPLEEEESNLIEKDHLSCFKGQQMRETFDMALARPVDGKDGVSGLVFCGRHPRSTSKKRWCCFQRFWNRTLVDNEGHLYLPSGSFSGGVKLKEVGPSSLLLIPYFPLVRYHSIHSTFDVPSTLNSTDIYLCGGYKENAETAGLKRKRSEVIHSLKLSRTHVDWHSVDEVYLYSDATTSKIARTVTQKLGFSKASSSGTRLHRGYVEEASLEDKPSPTTHIAFVIHGIGQKMDQGRIIRNAATLREIARKIEDKHFSNFATHVEFLPVEWRSKLALDGDTVDSITPDKIRGLRDILNSSAMDIMYYTSPLYRDELVKGLQQEMNRLYSLFCSRNPEFESKGGKVSIVSHSLGSVITYDIVTGWNPVRLYEQLVEKEYENLEQTWMSYEEQHLVEEFYLTKQRLRKLEERLRRLKASTMAEPPALQFKVENFFCMGSPLAVFLALRGIRPGSTGSQDHILSKKLCTRLLNIFHPTDPVAYRLEPLILKHYSNISPVQIHWYNTPNPLPYEQMKPSFLNPSKDPTSTSASESESVPTLPSPTTSPDVARRHYKESITNIGKASIMGAASLGKGIGGMLFSRFGRSNIPVSHALEGVKERTDGDENRAEVPVSAGIQTSQGLQSTQQSSGSGYLDSIPELDRRIDFELREGLVESRYWSAVTSHTAYWSSMDIALFLLTYMYKQDPEKDGTKSHPSHV